MTACRLPGKSENTAEVGNSS